MLFSEIFDILKRSKKYSKSNFRYDYNSYYDINTITYFIKNREYQIYITSDNEHNYYFKYDNFEMSIKSISVKISKNFSEKSIINNFSKFIKYINKLDTLIIKIDEILSKSKPIIKSYIKNEYNIQTDDCNIRIVLPKTSRIIYKKYKTTNFDVVIEDFNKINYDIYAVIKQDKIQYNFDFRYYSDNKLSIIRRDINYRDLSNDITKIIRSEKLKKIESSNDTI